MGRGKDAGRAGGFSDLLGARRGVPAGLRRVRHVADSWREAMARFDGAWGQARDVPAEPWARMVDDACAALVELDRALRRERDGDGVQPSDLEIGEERLASWPVLLHGRQVGELVLGEGGETDSLAYYAAPGHLLIFPSEGEGDEPTYDDLLSLDDPDSWREHLEAMQHACRDALCARLRHRMGTGPDDLHKRAPD